MSRSWFQITRTGWLCRLLDYYFLCKWKVLSRTFDRIGQFSKTETMQFVTNLFLLAHLLSLSAGLRVIANGLGLPVYGAEENVVDYAQLAVDKKAALPSQVRPSNMLVLIFFLFSSPSARLQHLMLCSPPSYSFNFSGSRGILGFHSLCWVGKTTYSNYR